MELPKICFLTCASIFKFIFPTPQKPIKGEIVVVTGAGHGIGKELAVQYAALDAVVVCIDINDQTNSTTVEAIKSMGKRVFGYICDVRSLNEVRKTFEKIQEEVGDVSILVNNAGIIRVGSILNVATEDVKNTFETNVFSHIWTLQMVLPSMIKNNHGHVVTIASGFSRLGLQYFSTYCSSKFAVRGLMQSVQNEIRLKPNNQIKFTIINPSIVDTGFYRDYSMRYHLLVPVVSPVKLAEAVICAQRRNIEEIAIPKHQNLTTDFLCILPARVLHVILDILELSVGVPTSR